MPPRRDNSATPSSAVRQSSVGYASPSRNGRLQQKSPIAFSRTVLGDSEEPTAEELRAFASEVPYRIILGIDAHVFDIVAQLDRDNKPLDWNVVTAYIRAQLVNLKPDSFIEGLLHPVKLETLYNELRANNREAVSLLSHHRDYHNVSRQKLESLYFIGRQRSYLRFERREGHLVELDRAKKVLELYRAGEVDRSTLEKGIAELDPILREIHEKSTCKDVEKEWMPYFRRTYKTFNLTFPFAEKSVVAAQSQPRSKTPEESEKAAPVTGHPLTAPQRLATPPSTSAALSNAPQTASGSSGLSKSSAEKSAPSVKSIAVASHSGSLTSAVIAKTMPPKVSSPPISSRTTKSASPQKGGHLKSVVDGAGAPVASSNKKGKKGPKTKDGSATDKILRDIVAGALGSREASRSDEAETTSTRNLRKREKVGQPQGAASKDAADTNMFAGLVEKSTGKATESSCVRDVLAYCVTFLPNDSPKGKKDTKRNAYADLVETVKGSPDTLTWSIAKRELLRYAFGSEPAAGLNDLMVMVGCAEKLWLGMKEGMESEKGAAATEEHSNNAPAPAKRDMYPDAFPLIGPQGSITRAVRQSTAVAAAVAENDIIRSKTSMKGRKTTSK